MLYDEDVYNGTAQYGGEQSDCRNFFFHFLSFLNFISRQREGYFGKP
jgi:hypothetical protein